MELHLSILSKNFYTSFISLTTNVSLSTASYQPPPLKTSNPLNPQLQPGTLSVYRYHAYYAATFLKGEPPTFHIPEFHRLSFFLSSLPSSSPSIHHIPPPLPSAASFMKPPVTLSEKMFRGRGGGGNEIITDLWCSIILNK